RPRTSGDPFCFVEMVLQQELRSTPRGSLPTLPRVMRPHLTQSPQPPYRGPEGSMFSGCRGVPATIRQLSRHKPIQGIEDPVVLGVPHPRKSSDHIPGRADMRFKFLVTLGA